MKTKILVDTCVWLDLAKDFKDQPVIGALSELVENGQVELVIPQMIVDEFVRNKARVIEDATRSLQAHFRLVRDAVGRFGSDESKAETLSALSEVDHAIVMKSEAVTDSFDRIVRLMNLSQPLVTSEDVKRRVTDRAIAKKAPYHRSKNSVGDAILVEIYADLVVECSEGELACAFDTHNINDFSLSKGDTRLPHEDLAGLFDGSKSVYSTTIVDVIKLVDPTLLDDHLAEFNYASESRSLSELLDAMHILDRKIWYNRHWNLRTKIEDGTHQVVSEENYSITPYRPDQTLYTVWEMALAAATRTEEEIGIDNLGPWNDFEWGMLNGKLSALRWVLGDEWDMLDT
jgi:predicted nucleic acid-binding protein